MNCQNEDDVRKMTWISALFNSGLPMCWDSLKVLQSHHRNLKRA